MNDVEDRREYIIGRHTDGWTYKRIGQELGITGSQVGRLYRLGLKGREKRKAAEARAAATLGTLVCDLGLPPELTDALVQMGCTDLCGILTRDLKPFEATVLRYPNVGRRALAPLNELRRRFE